MEYESRTPHHTSAEGLPLPKGTLEAGFGESSKKKSKPEFAAKARRSGKPLVRAAGIDSPPLQAAGSDISPAVSAWRRLSPVEQPVAESAKSLPQHAPSEIAHAVLAVEAGHKNTDLDELALRRQRRQAIDARPLEGSGEISLQPSGRPLPERPPLETEPIAASEVPTQPGGHLENVLEFPVDRARPSIADGASETAEAVPDIPPPIGPWMDGGPPRGPEGPSGSGGSGGDGEGPVDPHESSAATRSFAQIAEQPLADPNLMPRPSGYERTPADVRRAAGTGLVVGYLAGRLGKNRAIRRAVNAATRRFGRQQAKQARVAERYDRTAMADQAYQITATERLPAAANVVPVAAAAGVVAAERPRPTGQHIERVRERTRPQLEWLRPEHPVISAPPAERLAAMPLTELLAVPAAAVALRTVKELSPPAAAEATMNKVQLLEIAQTIKVEGVSARELYDSHQLDEEGLRSVVATYLRGGDVARQTQREMVEKQKQFERDPFNRRRGSTGSDSQNRDAGGGISGRLQDAAGSLAQAAGSVAGKTASSLSSGAKRVKQKANDGSEARQWAGIGAVVIIWAIILMLVL